MREEATNDARWRGTEPMGFQPHASCWKLVELEATKLNIKPSAEVRNERKEISDKWWKAGP